MISWFNCNSASRNCRSWYSCAVKHIYADLSETCKSDRPWHLLVTSNDNLMPIKRIIVGSIIVKTTHLGIYRGLKLAIDNDHWIGDRTSHWANGWTWFHSFWTSLPTTQIHVQKNYMYLPGISIRLEYHPYIKYHPTVGQSFTCPEDTWVRLFLS